MTGKVLDMLNVEMQVELARQRQELLRKSAGAGRRPRIRLPWPRRDAR